MMRKGLVARWESRSGKHWVELLEDGNGYSYSSPSAMGYVGCVSEVEALDRVQRMVDCGGYFQPDANVTPMRRVFTRR